jgi:hypothetical protein
MQAFGLRGLALEWHEDLAPVVEAFLATGTLADQWLLWPGDGRITAGHLAVLAERAAAGPLEVILFDGTIGAGWSWSDRDEAMARRIPAATAAGTRTLAVAGNAHTPTRPTERGVPMGGLAGLAAGGGAGDPDQLRRRALLERPAAPVRPARPAAAPGPASPAARRADSRPARSGGGARAPAVPGVAAGPHTTLSAARAIMRLWRHVG